MKNIEFIDKPNYFAEISALAKNSNQTKRLSLATMVFDNSEPCKQLIEDLIFAAKKGVKVTLCMDAYTFIVDQKNRLGPLFFSKNINKFSIDPWKSISKNLKKLEANGVNVVITNLPIHRFSIPFRGRSHMKFCANDEIVFIGSCNLTSANNIDIMAKLRSKKLATEIHKLVDSLMINSNVTEALNQTDRTIKISSDIELMIDAGVRKQSLIYQKALNLVVTAKNNIFMTCQYFPNGKMVQSLAHAYAKNVDVNLVYNNPLKHPFPNNVLHILVKFFGKLHFPAKLFANELPKGNRFIHSKILMNEDSLIIGSHNLVSAGVDFGTAEIALKINSSNYNKLVIDCINNQKI